MPRIPEDTLERIKEATDIVEIISEYVQLKKSGRHYKGLCPFHSEKTPSFTVNPELQLYKCFGCGAGGQVFKFIQEMDRVSFVEAVSFLAQRSGIPLPPAPGEGAESDFSDALYQANELARKYFHYLLAQNQGHAALDYCRRRDLGDETLERFGLGYAPSSWDGLLQVAARRGFQPGILERAGLASPRQKGGGHYDRFRDRLTFPIANLSGRTIAFGARALEADQEPKYLNSPETPIYHKSKVLYGLERAREAIRRGDGVLVVEGYMDLLSLAQRGIEHVVATAGTALTPEHCRILARYTRRAVLVFDADAAGSAAVLRGLEALLGTGLEARVVSLPAGHDPDSFVREQGAEALLERVERAGSALDFHLEHLARRHDLGTLSGKVRTAEELKPLLASCREPVRRDLLLREAAQRLGLDEGALRQEVQRSLRPRGGGPAAPPPPVSPEAPQLERHFLGLLLNYPRFIAPSAEALDPEAFSDARSRRLARVLFAEYRRAPSLDPSLLMSRFEESAMVEFISSCAMEGFDETQVEQQWQDNIVHFQQEALTRRIEQSKAALEEARRDRRDWETIKRLQAENERLIQARKKLKTARIS